MESDIQFRVYFNRRRQWLDVHLYNVSPRVFCNYAGTYYAYYQPETERAARRGLFGSLHFVSERMTPDTVVHELFHVLADWLRAKGMGITVYNEERLAFFFDELFRNFMREYKKVIR